ncbi:hypothetical protein RhiirA5_374061 [Rhizophagus irregularis]|uniref:Uncharacterized protein n=1 Tax=Rhizophagus irregularis TaxID=588596 RepID=A0A2I1DRS4_9GLOM|nr:hypothetical protein RhiirA5_374061 [Rhizophagus irregularis]PKY12578.1 hypothetical protein RhiirB3_378579 [Rhizophagus irregularis]
MCKRTLPHQNHTLTTLRHIRNHSKKEMTNYARSANITIRKSYMDNFQYIRDDPDSAFENKINQIYLLMHKMKNFKRLCIGSANCEIVAKKMWRKKNCGEKTTVYRRQGDLVLEFYERQRGSCKGLIVISYFKHSSEISVSKGKEYIVILETHYLNTLVFTLKTHRRGVNLIFGT